jgi:hypothetical protein
MDKITQIKKLIKKQIAEAKERINDMEEVEYSFGVEYGKISACNFLLREIKEIEKWDIKV